MKTSIASWCVSLIIMLLSGILNAQQFTNVADSQELFHTLTSTEKWGSGVSFFDFNNDGWDDIVLTQEYDSLTLLVNHEGTFEQKAFPIFINGRNKQCLWVDYDNDGDYDVILSTRFDIFRLYENLGDTLFLDVTSSAGLMTTNASNYGVSCGDFNRDGWLDLYVSRYNGSGDPLNPSQVNALYRNNGDGTFTNVTFEAGVSDGTQPSFQAAWIDFDKDGWQDIYVINDRTSWSNSLYRNNGDGTFTNVAEEAGALFAGNDPMTITVADFNHNGWLDIFMTNTGTGEPGSQKLSMLLENNGNGSFTEAAENYGVDFDKLSWGATWIDYDNDSFQDLYVCTGRSSNFFPLLPNHFYYNQSAEVFSDSTDVFLGPHVYSSFAVAKGDIDNNGFADLVVQNIEEANFLLWQNSGNQNNYIKVTLKGQVSNKMAIGSWIYVHVGENTYTHYTLCGENYLSQNSQHHIFGLASAELVDSVVVKYLSGHSDVYYNLSVNQHYYFTEGDTYEAVINSDGQVTLCWGQSTVISADEHHSYLWNTGDTTQSITVYESGLYYLTAWNEFGLPAYSDTVQVVVVPEAEVSFNTHAVSCPGGNDGSIEAVVSTGPMQEIVWNTGVQDTLLSELSEGLYSFTGLDSAGCEVEGTVYISQPPPFQHQITTTEAECFGDSTGSVEIAIVGGTPPYEYNWDTSDANMVPAGTYQATVTDQNGCIITLPYIIEEPDSLWAELFINPATDEANGSATVMISGGTPPYEILWSNGEENVDGLTDLAPGDYDIFITDFNGCPWSQSFVIEQVSGIDVQSRHQLKIFPNPAGDYVQISGCTEQWEFVLHNLTGETVSPRTVGNCPMRLNVAHLAVGTYILQMTSAGEHVVQCVMVGR